MTILEAQVDLQHADTLEQAFRATSAQLPPQIAHSFLVRDAADPTVWRIVTVWRSREALDEYRRSVDAPGGVRMFRAAGAEPALSIWEVASHAARAADGG
jgi:quinol monooxygenase YgiN